MAPPIIQQTRINSADLQPSQVKIGVPEPNGLLRLYQLFLPSMGGRGAAPVVLLHPLSANFILFLNAPIVKIYLHFCRRAYCQSELIRIASEY
jgi:hypothetical protein